MDNSEQLTIDIRPDSGVYGTFRRISYRPWSAIAEFIDNSTQNYFEHKRHIGEMIDADPVLEIDIVHDPVMKSLVIVDNANGMNWGELERAIQLNKPPANISGRSEFGMGLKMAACWFGSRWRVVTKRLGDTIEYNALVDVSRLEIDKPDAIVVQQRMGFEPSEHYTRIDSLVKSLCRSSENKSTHVWVQYTVSVPYTTPTYGSAQMCNIAGTSSRRVFTRESRIEIEDLHRTFRGRTLPSIRENIASMYRRDIDSGDITIRWNGQPFTWDKDRVFEEETPDGDRTRWEKDVQFNVDGHKVSGKVWIIIPGRARRAGMHLFRRDRLVVGGPGQGYKPVAIFAAPNSFQSQRLVGELDLDDWPVTQTKDGFDWHGELENGFIDKLKAAVSEYVEKVDPRNSPPDTSTKTTTSDGQVVGDSTKESLSGSDVDSVLTIVETGPPPPQILPIEDLNRMEQAAERSGEQPTYIHLGSEGVPTLKVYWLDNLPPSDIYASFDMPNDDELRLYVNLNHPFVERVISREPAKLELYALNLYADALVESGIRKRGQNVPAHTFRDFKDKFLRAINSR